MCPKKTISSSGTGYDITINGTDGFSEHRFSFAESYVTLILLRGIIVRQQCALKTTSFNQLDH